MALLKSASRLWSSRSRLEAVDEATMLNVREKVEREEERQQQPASKKKIKKVERAIKSQSIEKAQGLEREQRWF